MANHKTERFKGNGDILGRCQPTYAHMFFIRWRKHRLEFLRRREMDRIVQTGVRADTALKAARPSINLTKQLDLQPALVALHVLRRDNRASKLGDTNQADRCNEINQTLGNSHKGTDLTDGL
jgi:hypothetical protein